MHRMLPVLFLFALIHTGCGEKFIPGYHKTPYDGMVEYQRQLEAKLLRQHQNHPVHGSRVNRVKLEVSKDILVDVAGRQHKVEWAQLVYDNWGHRIPELEREFFVVVFSKPGDTPEVAGRRHNIKPSLTVGMKAMGMSGELRPVTALVREDSSSGLYCPSCGQASRAGEVCALCHEKHSAGEVSIPAPVAPAPPALSPLSRVQQGIPSSVNVKRWRPVQPVSPLTGQNSLSCRQDTNDTNTVESESSGYKLPVNRRSLGGVGGVPSTESEELPVNQVALPEDSSPASHPTAEISVIREANPEEDFDPVVLDRF